MLFDYPHELPSIEMGETWDIICERNRRSFEALMDEIHFWYHYYPTKMTTPGQVDDRPGLTGIEYIGQYYGG